MNRCVIDIFGIERTPERQRYKMINSNTDLEFSLHTTPLRIRIAIEDDTPRCEYNVLPSAGCLIRKPSGRVICGDNNSSRRPKKFL